MAIESTDESTKGMIDIAEKTPMKRKAIAEGKIYLNSESIHSIQNGTNPKGDVLENAKLAAIHAVKKTPEMVFMCHPIRISSVKVDFKIDEKSVTVQVQVSAIDKTGVEIEAVSGVMNALLAIFDLSKRYEKLADGSYPTAKITDIKVLKKIKEEVI